MRTLISFSAVSGCGKDDIQLTVVLEGFDIGTELVLRTYTLQDFVAADI